MADSRGVIEHAHFMAAWCPDWPEAMGQDLDMPCGPLRIGQSALWQHFMGQQLSPAVPPRRVPSRQTGPEKLKTASNNQI